MSGRRIGRALVVALWLSAASGAEAHEGVVHAFEEASNALNLDVPPCPREIRVENVLGSGRDCSDPSVYSTRSTSSACNDFYGFVCGGTAFAGQLETQDKKMLKRHAEIRRTLAEAALDVWLERAAVTPPTHSVSLSAPPSAATETVALYPGPPEYPASPTDLTQAAIERLRASSSAADRTRAADLELLRGRLTKGNFDAWPADFSPGRCGTTEYFRANQGSCVDVHRSRQNDTQVAQLAYEVGYGTAPHPAADALGVTQNWAKVTGTLDRIKTTMIARLRDTRRTANMDAAQRDLAIRIIENVRIFSPQEMFSTQEGREFFDSRCASELAPGAAYAEEFPHHDADGHFHHDGIIVCPASAAVMPEAWFEYVLTHELTHSMDASSMESYANDLLTDEHLSDTSVSQDERDYFRMIAGGASPPNSAAQGLLRRLYGENNETRGEFDLRTRRVMSQGDDPSEELVMDRSWADSIGGCYEAFSRCRRREMRWGNDTYAFGSNPEACDPCFQLFHANVDEIVADDRGATIFGDFLLERTPRLSGNALRTRLREAYGFLCYSGQGTSGGSAHPNGPARLARVIGENVNLRRGMGCSYELEDMGRYVTPCTSGWESGWSTDVPRRGRCMPRDTAEEPESWCGLSD